ncbi:MAG: hypothetical protein AAF283_04905 [Cyanobacteria bacterium P01_A01_bin.70]
MAILDRFLHFLQLLEDLAELGEFLTTPMGSTLIFCGLSYQALTVLGCAAPSAAILASTAALALHCTTNRPTF